MERGLAPGRRGSSSAQWLPPKANSYHLNGLVRSTAQADLIIGLGGDGTLLEPVVDGNTDRLLHEVF